MSAANKFTRLLFALALTAGLTVGCANLSADPTSVPETAESSAPETTAVTGQTIPDTDLVPQTGISITADGDELESGSLLFSGVPYVNAGEFLSVLDHGVCTGDDSAGFVLEWDGRHYRFDPGSETVLVDHQAIALFSPVLTYRSEIWFPVEEICTMLGISMLEDPEYDRLYCTSGFPSMDMIRGIRVPILMYHAVDSNVWGYEDLFVDPEVMEQHLIYLLENGYDPIFFQDLDHIDQYDKPIILTVDDGYLDNYTNLYPLIEKYQVKATIFVVTSSIRNRETSMTPEMIETLSDSGLVSIQSHTVSHSILPELSPEDQLAEMQASKLEVARMTGREPFAFSYPTGAYSRETLDLVRECYLFAVTVNEDDYITGSDPLLVCRYNVRRTTTAEELAEMVSNAGKSE